MCIAASGRQHAHALTPVGSVAWVTGSPVHVPHAAAACQSVEARGHRTVVHARRPGCTKQHSVSGLEGARSGLELALSCELCLKACTAHAPGQQPSIRAAPWSRLQPERPYLEGVRADYERVRTPARLSTVAVSDSFAGHLAVHPSSLARSERHERAATVVRVLRAASGRTSGMARIRLKDMH